MYPAPGRLVNACGQRLHLYETGEGRPAVVLESGISASTLNWRAVQTGIAKFTRVVSYERAGLGWSDPCCTARTPSRIVEELRALLLASGVEPPYVLVGHSFGGLVVRSFALRYPRDVAGVVLVDALRPEEWTPMSPRQQLMLDRGARLSRRGAVLARAGIVRFCLKSVVAGSRWLPRTVGRAASGRGAMVIDRIAGEVRKMPEEVWPMIAAHWCDPKSFRGMEAHLRALPGSIREMADAPPIEAIPVTVLTAGQSESNLSLDVNAIARDAKHIVAEHSGHWIQLDEPGLVIAAVKDIVEQARSSS